MKKPVLFYCCIPFTALFTVLMLSACATNDPSASSTQQGVTSTSTSPAPPAIYSPRPETSIPPPSRIAINKNDRKKCVGGKSNAPEFIGTAEVRADVKLYQVLRSDDLGVSRLSFYICAPGFDTGDLSVYATETARKVLAVDASNLRELRVYNFDGTRVVDGVSTTDLDANRLGAIGSPVTRQEAGAFKKLR